MRTNNSTLIAGILETPNDFDKNHEKP